MGKLTGTEAHRDRILKAALTLLTKQGRDAVTTRNVAEAAKVQPPVLYRIFGDKTGVLDAVAAYGFTAYLAKKHPPEPNADPVQALRAGWDLHGLALVRSGRSRRGRPAVEPGQPGAVGERCDESCRPQIYRPRDPQARTQRQLLRHMLDRVFGGSTRAMVLQALSEKKTSPQDLKAIERLLDKIDGEKK